MALSACHVSARNATIDTANVQTAPRMSTLVRTKRETHVGVVFFIKYAVHILGRDSLGPFVFELVPVEMSGRFPLTFRIEQKHVSIPV